MRKLKLNISSSEGTNILTREQMKKVIGGDGGSGSNGVCNFMCNGSCVSHCNGVRTYGWCNFGSGANVGNCYCTSVC